MMTVTEGGKVVTTVAVRKIEIELCVLVRINGKRFWHDVTHIRYQACPC